MGYAASAVDLKKQTHLISGAKKYLKDNPQKAKDKQPRFDVIEIYLDKSTLKEVEINHIENAFGA